MIYNNLILNNKIWDRLKIINKKKKIPNAILFHGPNGTGKEGHAIEFAALINCQSNLDNPCGSCGSCIRIKNLSDENLNIIFPMPRGKITSKKDNSIKALSDKEIDIISTLYKQKAINPYKRIVLEKSKTILINSIIDLKKKIYFSNELNRYKVVLILDAEKLSFPNNESANALLKILEEPPERTCFILISSSENKIIETIKSRCQSYFFPPLSHDNVQLLLDRMSTDQDITKLISAISDGNISFAQEILNANYDCKLDLQHTIRSIYKKGTSNGYVIFRP